VLIRAGLIAVLVVASWQVFHPFMVLMIWAVILAVTLYPLHTRLKRRLGNKDGRAATLLVLISIALIMVPVYLLGLSLAASVGNAVEMARSGSIHVPPPADSVAVIEARARRARGKHRPEPEPRQARSRSLTLPRVVCYPRSGRPLRDPREVPISVPVTPALSRRSRP